MKHLKIFLLGFVMAGLFFSCKDDIESPSLSEDERNLIRQSWEGDGVYIQDVKLDSIAVSHISLTFNSRSSGLIKDVSVNNIPGGSWELTGNSLKIKYPAGLTTELDSVVLTISTLTETELNLTSTQEVNVFNVFTLSPEAELRLVPKE